MKNIYIILAALLTTITFYASSQNIGDLNGIYYQAVAIDENGKEIVGKDVEGKPLYNKTIGVRFTITSGLNGPVQWEETHTTNTDKYGLFTLTIGQGQPTGSAAFNHLLDIPWIDANQFLKVEISTKNDGNYKMVSNHQFMAVPYSFYTDDIADDAITTAKILDFTILNQDVSTGAIDSRTILDETILNEDIATGSVDSRTILDETILNEDIATGSVDSRTILDETILNEDIATGSVDSRTILDETILNEDIATGSVDSRTILDETILNEDVGTGAIDSRAILDETILNEDVATGAIDSRAILDETILNEDVATGSVDSRTILDETILNEDIATGSVDSRTILDETILNEDIATGSVDSRTILDGTLLNEDIADGTIDLTSKVSGVLPVENGGMGLSIINQGDILIGTGSNSLSPLAVNDSIMLFSNINGDTELFKLRAGARTFINIDPVNKIIEISAVDQSGGPNTGSSQVSVGNIADGEQRVRNFPHAGVMPGDIILATTLQDLQGITLTAYVRQEGQVNVIFFNGSGQVVNMGVVDVQFVNFGQP